MLNVGVGPKRTAGPMGAPVKGQFPYTRHYTRSCENSVSISTARNVGNTEEIIREISKYINSKQCRKY